MQQLDIEGVKLYMSSEDALRALKARFPTGTFRVGHSSTTVIVPKFRRIESIEYEDASLKLAVHFTDALPASHQKEQVITVSLFYKGYVDRDENHTAAFLNLAIQKYGRPNKPGYFTDEGRRADFWCSEDSPIGTFVMECNDDYPYLEFSQNELTLSDPTLTEHVARALTKPEPEPKQLPLPHL